MYIVIHAPLQPCELHEAVQFSFLSRGNEQFNVQPRMSVDRLTLDAPLAGLLYYRSGDVLEAHLKKENRKQHCTATPDQSSQSFEIVSSAAPAILKRS